MDTSQILADLHDQRDRIDQAIAAVVALDATAVTPAKTAAKAASPSPGPKPTDAAKRVVSPEACQRMAEAQQKPVKEASKA
jgi:hypothetical protein